MRKLLLLTLLLSVLFSVPVLAGVSPVLPAAEVDKWYYGYPSIDTDNEITSSLQQEYVEEFDMSNIAWGPELYIIYYGTSDSIDYINLEETPFSRTFDDVAGTSVYYAKLPAVGTYTVNYSLNGNPSSRTFVAYSPENVQITKSMGESLDDRAFYSFQTEGVLTDISINHDPRVIAIQSDSWNHRAYTKSLESAFSLVQGVTWHNLVGGADTPLHLYDMPAYNVERGESYFAFTDLLPSAGDFTGEVVIPGDPNAQPLAIEPDAPMIYYEPQFSEFPQDVYIPIADNMYNSEQTFNETIVFDNDVASTSVMVNGVTVPSTHNLDTCNFTVQSQDIHLGKNIVRIDFTTLWGFPGSYTYTLYGVDYDMAPLPETRGETISVNVIPTNLPNYITITNKYDKEDVNVTENVDTNFTIGVDYYLRDNVEHSERGETNEHSFTSSKVSDTQVDISTSFYFIPPYKKEDDEVKTYIWTRKHYNLSGLTNNSNDEQIVYPIDQLGTN